MPKQTCRIFSWFSLLFYNRNLIWRGPVNLEGNYNFTRIEPIGTPSIGQEFRDGPSIFLSNPDNSALQHVISKFSWRRNRTDSHGHPNTYTSERRFLEKNMALIKPKLGNSGLEIAPIVFGG